MDTYDIFKKLTTNLKFENKQKTKQNVSPKLAEPVLASTATAELEKSNETGNGQNGSSVSTKKDAKKGNKTASASKETALESIMRQYKEKVRMKWEDNSDWPNVFSLLFIRFECLA